MVDPNTRQGKRTPVTLKIKFKSETLEQFIERYAVDVSQGGIFIRTKEPLAVGTQMRFEFQLRDASPLIAGEGTVVWTRENDPSRPAIAPGMGVRFDRLADGSQGVLERILSEKAKQAPARPAEQTKPPMFTDTPTRIAPMPVQEALLSQEGGRKRSDSFGEQGTPLPRPMPFHSDADEFDDQAFEEATKVRALDDLIAETAGFGKVDERRSPRVDAAPSEPPRAETATSVEVPKATVVDRDSAPVLPSPPEASRPRLLETTPSPRAEAAAPAPSPSSSSSSASDSGKMRLGVESAKVPVRPTPAPVVAKDAVTKPTGMRAVAHESSAKMPVAKTGGSAASLAILLLLLVAAGAAAVWFFVLREKAEESVATTPPIDSGSGSADLGSASPTGMIANGSGSSSDTGSGSGSADMTGSGSAAANTGSGSAAVTPAAELVETVIAAVPDKATVEILGTGQKGATPLKAKLEKGTSYKARVQAPGFSMMELDIKGGDPKTTAKLVPKPRMITVSTQPAGAVIFVDNQSTGKTTPSTIELTKAQAARRSVRIGLRKTNYKSVERVVDTSKYTEDASRMIATVEEPLSVQVPITNNNTPTTTNNAVKTGSGSAATPAGSGSTGTTTGSGGATAGSATPPAGAGSAATPTPTPGTGSATTTPMTPPKPMPGAGSATTPKPTPSAGTATTPAPTPLTDGPKQPEPDFMKKL